MTNGNSKIKYYTSAAKHAKHTRAYLGKVVRYLSLEILCRRLL